MNYIIKEKINFPHNIKIQFKNGNMKILEPHNLFYDHHDKMNNNLIHE